VYRSKKIERIEEIHIEKIYINGASKKQKKYLDSIFNLKELKISNKEEIDYRIKKLINTGHFGKINYKYQENILTVNIIGHKKNEFRTSFRFDSDNKASLLFNLTFKDFAKRSNKTLFDLKLGNNQSLELINYYYTGFYKKVGIVSIFNVSNYDNLYEYNEDGKKVMSYDVKSATSNIYLGTTLADYDFVGLGAGYEMVNTKPDIDISVDELEYHYGYFAFYGIYDDRDKKFFTSSGSKIECNVMINKRFFQNDIDFVIGRLDMERAFSINDKLTFEPKLSTGFSSGDHMPSNKPISLGGVNNDFHKAIEFYGIDENQIGANNIISAKLDMNYEYKKDRYIILGYNMANISESRNEILEFENRISGLCVGFGAETPMGPLKLFFQNSNKNESKIYFSVGYTF